MTGQTRLGESGGVVAMREDTIDLTWLAIEQRKEENGRILLAEAEKPPHNRGVKLARLGCFGLNTGAIAFYEKIGQRKEGIFLSPRQQNKHL